MEEYLNKGIKEIIEEFPPVADILNQYDIGCGPCSVGSCLLKDIVEIHNLTPEDEADLMAGIARVIYPGQKVAVPRIERQSQPPAGAVSYSPPMQKLVDEHILIKRLVAVIPGIVDGLDVASEPGRQTIRDIIDFIRSYADKYHHAKEEDILFKYFDEGLDILKTMHTDHENARARVRAILSALDQQDGATIAAQLTAYHELLTEHIKKEDEILYRWMDRMLSSDQISQLADEFNRKELEFGDITTKYEALVNQLETKIKLQQWRSFTNSARG